MTTLFSDRATGKAPIFAWTHTVPAGDISVRLNGSAVPQAMAANTGFGYNAAEGPATIGGIEVVQAAPGGGDPYVAFLDAVLTAAGELTGLGEVYWIFDPEEAYPRPVYAWPDGLGTLVAGDGVSVPAHIAEALGLNPAPAINEFQIVGGEVWLIAKRASPGYWCPASMYADARTSQQYVGTIRSAAFGPEVAVLNWRKNDRLEFEIPAVPLARIWQFNRDDPSFADIVKEGTATRHNLFERLLEHAAGLASQDPVIRVYPWDRIASTSGVKVCRWTEPLADTSRFVRQSSGLASERDISFTLRVVDTVTL